MDFDMDFSFKHDCPTFVCLDCKVYASFIGFDEKTQTWEVIRGALPGGGVCDFCSSNDPEWEYPAQSFDHQAYIVDEDGVEKAPDEQGSIGSWAACDDCKEFIEAGDLRGLSDRSLDHMPSGPPPAYARESVLEGLMQLHQMFFDSRKGPVLPIDWSVAR